MEMIVAFVLAVLSYHVYHMFTARCPGCGSVALHATDEAKINKDRTQYDRRSVEERRVITQHLGIPDFDEDSKGHFPPEFKYRPLVCGSCNLQFRRHDAEYWQSISAKVGSGEATKMFAEHQNRKRT